MKCFYCPKPACAKIGTANGNLLGALLGQKAWDKKEIYVCRLHFELKPEGTKL